MLTENRTTREETSLPALGSFEFRPVPYIFLAQVARAVRSIIVWWCIALSREVRPLRRLGVRLVWEVFCYMGA